MAGCWFCFVDAGCLFWVLLLLVCLGGLVAVFVGSGVCCRFLVVDGLMAAAWCSWLMLVVVVFW